MSNNGFQGFPAVTAQAMVQLQKLVAGAAGSATFDFLSIPGTYTDLILRGVLRSDFSATLSLLGIKLNGDAGANYNVLTLTATGAATTESYNLGSTAGGGDTGIAGGTAPANSPSWFELILPNYSGTVFNKVFRAVTHVRFDATASGNRVYQNTTEWLSTVPVNRITVFPLTGNFATNSELTLWGML